MFSKNSIFSLLLLFGLMSSPALAGEMSWSGHHSVAGKSYISSLSEDQKIELHRYLNYEHREPCQNYREVPSGFSRKNCKLYYGQCKKSPVKADKKMGRVVKSFTLYFGFDSANLTQTSKSTLAKISAQIKKHSPDQVTVSGYTDTSGSAKYNEALSQRRAKAVSKALADRGIANKTLSSRSLGETRLAINTGNGVRRAENRRVVVEFREN